MHRPLRRWLRGAITTLTVLSGASAVAQSPIYNATIGDDVTGDNAYWHNGSRYWEVDPGADNYQWNYYERPTVQSYAMRGGRYSSNEYFEYLDITHAKVGFDAEFLYVAVDLFGRNKSTSDGQNSEVGLSERYGFSFSLNEDGRNGFLFVGDQPESPSNNTVFTRQKTFGYRDTDGDVGGRGLFNGGPTGLGVTKTDNPLEEAGLNGYNSAFVSDGRYNGMDVLSQRIDPTDDTVVEFALKYTSLGMTAGDLVSLTYFNVEAIKGGPKDPQNYLWNDKYTATEAGSPNPGAGGLSEFGTQGLGNLYELDTLYVGAMPVPEPSTALILGSGALLVIARVRRRHPK